MKCEKCGSENVILGKLSSGFGGILFTTVKAIERFPFTKNYSGLSASGCKNCGHVFDIKMLNPERINLDH